MPWVSNGSGIIDQASTFHLIGVVHSPLSLCYLNLGLLKDSRRKKERKQKKL
jgi:hypothetical protein